MGWFIALAVIVLLAIFPLGVRGIYAEAAPGVWLLAGPLKFQLYPGKPKTEKNTKEKKKAGEPAGEKPKKAQTKKGGSYRDFLPIVQIALQFLDHFRRKLRVKHLELRLIMAGGDPDTLAVNYGKAWIALGNLMPQLERFLVIRKRHLEVECDFVEEVTRIYARVDVTITVGRALYLLLVYGLRILKHFLQMKNTRKGGVKHEPKSTEYVRQYHHENS